MQAEQDGAAKALSFLVIDDMPDDRSLVIRELSHRFPGARCQEIVDADGLSRALERGEFDATITDYQIRWTDGLSVLHSLKLRYWDRPVIMFTGTGSEEVAVEAMKSGLDDYVIKSKGYRALAATVQTVLQKAEVIKSEGPRLLIVDDDPSLLEALTDFLTARLHRVSVDASHSSQDALARIAANDYDAVVSDIKMPHMDGLTLMSRIHDLQPMLPTLLMTGHGDQQLCIQALQHGAYMFVAKPIDREYFIAWVERAVQLRRLLRTVERQNHALANHAKEFERMLKERTAILRKLQTSHPDVYAELKSQR